MNYTGKTFKEATKEDLIAIAVAAEVAITSNCKMLTRQSYIVLQEDEIYIEFWDYGEIHSELETLYAFAAVDKARELGYYLPSNTLSSGD